MGDKFEQYLSELSYEFINVLVETIHIHGEEPKLEAEKSIALSCQKGQNLHYNQKKQTT